MKLVLAILITCFVCDFNALNSEPDLMSLITELVKNNKLDDLVTENPSLNSKDLSHFGLYYKSDLPERSVSHKIENQVHYMDPNLMTQLYQDNWNYDSNNINSNQVNLDISAAMKLKQQNDQNLQRSNLIKMFLLNVIPKIKTQSVNNENDMHYNVVHLRLKLKPKIKEASTGYLQNYATQITDNGSKMTPQLPEFINSLLSSIHFKKQNETPIKKKLNRKLNFELQSHSIVNENKRSDNEESTLEKRAMPARFFGRFSKKNGTSRITKANRASKATKTTTTKKNLETSTDSNETVETTKKIDLRNDHIMSAMTDETSNFEDLN